MSLVPLRHFVALAFAALTLAAGCKADADRTLLTDSGTLASPTLNAAVLDYPSDTELTDELINRWLAATKDLDALPEDADAMVARADSAGGESDPVGSAIERLEASPAATQYLARHDFSPKEYVETTVALYQAYAMTSHPGIAVTSRDQEGNVALLQRRPDAVSAASGYFDSDARARSGTGNASGNPMARGRKGSDKKGSDKKGSDKKGSDKKGSDKKGSR